MQSVFVFCFLLGFAPVLGLLSQKGSENCTERTHGFPSGVRLPLLLYDWLFKPDNKDQKGFALVLRLVFWVPLILRRSVLFLINSGK